MTVESTCGRDKGKFVTGYRQRSRQPLMGMPNTVRGQIGIAVVRAEAGSPQRLTYARARGHGGCSNLVCCFAPILLRSNVATTTSIFCVLCGLIPFRGPGFERPKRDRTVLRLHRVASMPRGRVRRDTVLVRVPSLDYIWQRSCDNRQMRTKSESHR